MRLLGCVVGEDGSLDCSTVCHGLVRVDALVGLFAAEEVRHEPDDTGDTGGSTNEDDFVDASPVDFRVAEDFLDWLESTAEEVLAKFGWRRKGPARMLCADSGEHEG